MRAHVGCWAVLIFAMSLAASPAPAQNLAGEQSPAAYLKLIGEMRASGRPRAALAHLDAFEASHPKDSAARLLRADCLVDVGQYAAARQVYEGLAKGAQGAAAYAGLGRIAALEGDWIVASGAFGEAVKRQPINPAYVGDLGFALLRAGDVQASLFRLRQAAELAPDSPTVRNNLILALEADGQAAAARRLLDQVTDPKERDEIAAMRGELAGSAAKGVQDEDHSQPG